MVKLATLTGVKILRKFTPIKVVIYASIFPYKKLYLVVEKYYNFFLTLISVKILCKFTPIKVVNYSSNFYCKKLPFVVEINSTTKGGFLHYTLMCHFFDILPFKVSFSHPLGLTVQAR